MNRITVPAAFGLLFLACCFCEGQRWDLDPGVMRVPCLRILQATNVCGRPGSLQYYTLTHSESKLHNIQATRIHFKHWSDFGYNSKPQSYTDLKFVDETLDAVSRGGVE